MKITEEGVKIHSESTIKTQSMTLFIVKLGIIS